MQNELTAERVEQIGRIISLIESGQYFPRGGEHVDTILAALQDAQRRERAAVEDMKVGWLCRACIKRVKGKEWCNCPAVNFVNGPENTTTCDNFEWRGPVAGKGE